MNETRTSVGQAEINFAFSRHLGPKFEHGSVRLRFDSLQPYAFSSSAVWPENINYEGFVKAGVEKALLEKVGTLQTTRVELVGIELDEIDSTPYGFEKAAYAATCAAFLA